MRGDQITYVQEYFGFLERYYFRMYIQELRDEFFETMPGTEASYPRLAYPLLPLAETHYEEVGRTLALEGVRPVLRYTSISRSRSRSRDL